MKPDAIPVRALGSRAVVTAADAAVLFGPNARLAPSASVEVVRAGQAVGRVGVEIGPTRSLVLDATAPSATASGAVSLRGSVGAVGPLEAEAVRSRLVLPDGLRRAWGVSERAVVALGAVALAVPVEAGAEPAVEVERALWLGAGRPQAARWLAGVDLAEPVAPDPAVGPVRIERRVVTETDVRQARLKHRRIRLSPGQIVTPAARSLGDEWGVFEGE